jgi:hypothetical protein
MVCWRWHSDHLGTDHATQQGSFTAVDSTDDNSYFSENVRVCDKDVRNTEERYKVTGFSGMWWSYNHLTPRPDPTGYDQLQQASIQ